MLTIASLAALAIVASAQARTCNFGLSRSTASPVLGKTWTLTVTPAGDCKGKTTCQFFLYFSTRLMPKPLNLSLLPPLIQGFSWCKGTTLSALPDLGIIIGGSYVNGVALTTPRGPSYQFSFTVPNHKSMKGVSFYLDGFNLVLYPLTPKGQVRLIKGNGAWKFTFQ